MIQSTCNEQHVDQLQSSTQTDRRTLRNDYIEYIRTSYSRISEHQQHSGVTRWALLGALAYIAWQSVPMLVEVKIVNSGWSSLCLVSALLLVISCFGFQLYQGLSVNSSPSKYEIRQFGVTASTGTSLSLLTVFTSIGPAILFACLAWKFVPNLPDMTYRFLSLTAWVLSTFGVMVCGVILFNARYVQKNGHMPAGYLAATTGVSTGVAIVSSVVQLSFVSVAAYFLAKSIDVVPPRILKEVLLLGGSIALVPPCISVILSGVRTQGRLNLLSMLERDILIHDLPPEEIKARLENDLIGSELGEWAKRQVEAVRAIQNELIEYCEKVPMILQEVTALNPSLTYERQGRLQQSIDKLNSLIDELKTHWEPLNSWLRSCRTQPLRDPYITRVLDQTLDDLTPLMQSAMSAARHAVESLRSCSKEIK